MQATAVVQVMAVFVYVCLDGRVNFPMEINNVANSYEPYSN